MVESQGNKAWIASALGNIGLVQHAQGNYAQALEHNRKSLSLFEALGDKQGIARRLNNIGIIYRAQGNYALAMEFY